MRIELATNNLLWETTFMLTIKLKGIIWSIELVASLDFSKF